MTTQAEQVLALTREHGYIRPRDLRSPGLPRVALTRLVRQGQLVRLDRGLYATPNYGACEHTVLAQVARKCPHGIICLLSALRVHDLTTQSPHEVWLTIPNKARKPMLSYPPLRTFRCSGQALTAGVEVHELDSTPVKVTSVARTITDCFKYRNKIGLSVALEALREAWQNNRVTMDELWYHATVCRVTNVMQPYLESICAET